MTANQQEDWNLINLILKKKDKTAHEKLYKKYIGAVTRRLIEQTRSVELSKDLAHESLEKSFENLKSFSSKKACFSTWLYKITKNALLDWKKLKENKKIYATDVMFSKHKMGIIIRNGENDSLLRNPSALETCNFDLPEQTRTPEDIFYSQFMVNLIHKTLKEFDMSDKHKMILELRYFKDLNYEEISYAVNAPLHVVR